MTASAPPGSILVLQAAGLGSGSRQDDRERGQPCLNHLCPLGLSWSAADRIQASGTAFYPGHREPSNPRAGNEQFMITVIIMNAIFCDKSAAPLYSGDKARGIHALSRSIWQSQKLWIVLGRRSRC